MFVWYCFYRCLLSQARISNNSLILSSSQTLKTQFVRSFVSRTTEPWNLCLQMLSDLLLVPKDEAYTLNLKISIQWLFQEMRTYFQLYHSSEWTRCQHRLYLERYKRCKFYRALTIEIFVVSSLCWIFCVYLSIVMYRPLVTVLSLKSFRFGSDDETSG